MINDVFLIQVRALSAKMANQIQFADFRSEEHRKILNGLRDGEISPLGWIAPGVVKVHGASTISRLWLVQCGGQLYLINPPYGGDASQSTPDWMKKCCDGLSQLFVS